MKKSLKIIGIVIIINIVLVVLACAWAKGLKKDQKETKAKMQLVLTSYKDFDSSIDEFSNKRNKLYEYKEDLYFETLSANADSWNKFMEEYAEGIKKVENTSKELKNNCDIEYGDVGTRSKCTSFKANYEAAHNYYISDVKMYNKLVDSYNEWNSEQKGKYKTVNKATYPVYEKYIDYDKDGEYFGKEEVSINE